MALCNGRYYYTGAGTFMEHEPGKNPAGRQCSADAGKQQATIPPGTTQGLVFVIAALFADHITGAPALKTGMAATPP